MLNTIYLLENENFHILTYTIMQLVYPPKFCISIVSNFLLGVTVVPRQLEDDGKILGGTQGAL